MPSLNTAGAARNRDAVAFDLPVQRIAADVEMCRHQRHVPVIPFDYLYQRLTFSAFERYLGARPSRAPRVTALTARLRSVTPYIGRQVTQPNDVVIADHKCRSNSIA